MPATPPPSDNAFKKQPRRKADRGRSVSVSPEMREAYEARIKEEADKEARLRHLPDRDRRS